MKRPYWTLWGYPIFWNMPTWWKWNNSKTRGVCVRKIPQDRTHGRYIYRSRGTLDGKGGLRLQYQKLGFVPPRSTGHNLAKWVIESEQLSTRLFFYRDQHPQLPATLMCWGYHKWTDPQKGFVAREGVGTLKNPVCCTNNKELPSRIKHGSVQFPFILCTIYIYIHTIYIYMIYFYIIRLLCSCMFPSLIL